VGVLTKTDQHNPLTLPLVQAAGARINRYILRTPVLTSEQLDADANATLFFKCENLQRAGAFKARGATNAVFSLSDEEARRGVVTHSSGNHAAALSRAAELRAIPAYIVMPDNATRAKQALVKRYGGQIVLCESTVEAREKTAQQVAEKTGATFIHPYNDLRVMAGQGTTALELLEEIPHLDLILCPVGGGGLLSGVAAVVKNLRPSMKVIGVEPSGADDAQRSFQAGRIIPNVKPNTIADGLRTSLGDQTFSVIRRYVDNIVTVSDEAIVRAMRLLWETLKIIVEPSGAVAYAALVEGTVDVRGTHVALILSGGNVDLDTLPW
jgi:threonine dehydratase